MALIRSAGASGAKAKYGVVTLNGTNPTTVTLGWKPKFLYVRWGATASDFVKVETYDETISTSNTYVDSANNLGVSHAIPNSSANYVNSINNNGFTLGNYASNVRTAVYCAFG